MNIKETELPGIGRKYSLETRSGDKVVIVIHDDDSREVYHFEENNPEQCLSSVTLDDKEARQIAGIIGGMTYKPKALETIETAFNDLVIEWHKIEPGSDVIGKTIGELGIRQNYGIIIIAIIEKDNSKAINPGPEQVLHEGATLVISGEWEQMKILKKKLLSSEV